MPIDNAILKQLEKNIGVKPMQEWEPPDFIQTGSLSLDYYLGGGLPRGGLGLFTGDSYTGKTTLSLLISENIVRNRDQMKNGGNIAYFDMERRSKKNYLESFGLSPDNGFYLFRPETGSQLLNSMTVLLEQKAVDFIVVDSVATTAFDSEISADADDTQVSLAARKWGAWIKGNLNRLSRSGAFIYFINRPTAGIGQYAPETYYGGKWQKFQNDIHLSFLAPDKKVKDYLTLRVKARKNSIIGDINMPKDALDINIFMPPGRSPVVDPVPELIDLGAKLGIFTKEDGSPISGNCSYYMDGAKIGKGSGAPGVREVLYTDHAMRQKVGDRVVEAMHYRFWSAPKSEPAAVPEKDNDVDE